MIYIDVLVDAVQRITWRLSLKCAVRPKNNNITRPLRWPAATDNSNNRLAFRLIRKSNRMVEEGTITNRRSNRLRRLLGLVVPHLDLPARPATATMAPVVVSYRHKSTRTLAMSFRVRWVGRAGVIRRVHQLQPPPYPCINNSNTIRTWRHNVQISIITQTLIIIIIITIIITVIIRRPINQLRKQVSFIAEFWFHTDAFCLCGKLYVYYQFIFLSNLKNVKYT